jgi:hypothetical protein
MPTTPAKCKLIFGPYRPPRLHVGDRTECLLRGTVKITSWTAARISWPRCQAVGAKGGSGVFVDDELAGAVRNQAAAAAVCYLLGVFPRRALALAEGAGGVT